MFNFYTLSIPIIKRLVTITGAILIVSACNAQPPVTDENESVPVESEKVVPSDEVVPRPLDDEQADNQMRPTPCTGVPANLVSPRVQEFLTCELISILTEPDSVKGFKVKSDPDVSTPENERLGDYPIKPDSPSVTLNEEQLKKLQGAIFSEKSYVFGFEKRCRFRPEIGLHFVKDDKSVEVLLSFACDLWLFVHQDKTKLEDFDPVHKELSQLHNSLFPVSSTSVQD